MCTPASFIVTKSRVFWSAKSDSHEDIIAEHALHERRGRINFVRVEICPKDGDLCKPFSEWVFRTDQNQIPKWYDVTECEQRVRAELEAWYRAKVLLSGSREIHDAQIYCLGESRAVLWGTSRAVLWGTSQAELRGNCQAVLWGTSQAELYGTSRAVLWGKSYAELHDTSRAVLRGNSIAVLCDHSHAELRDHSHAELWGTSSAELCDHSHAELWGDSQAMLQDASIATKYSTTATWTINDSAVGIDRTGNKPKCYLRSSDWKGANP